MTSSAAAVAAVALLAASLGAALAQERLCYEIRWDLANPNGPSRQLLRPATTFPSQHAAVTTNVCADYEAGDEIPHEGRWTQDDEDSCRDVSGGELFYAYNKPYTWSSNTGYEEHETELLYFSVDVSCLVRSSMPTDAQPHTSRCAFAR